MGREDDSRLKVPTELRRRIDPYILFNCYLRLFFFRNFSHQSAIAFDSERNGRSRHLVKPTQHNGTESDRFHVVFATESVHGLDGQGVLQKEQIVSQLAVHQQQTGTSL